MNDIFATIRTYIADRIAEGFDSPIEIIESAQDYIVYEYETDYYLEHIEQITADLLAMRRDHEQSWEELTDCDRLDRAFALLSLHGIVARQHFTCCQTCGHYEIWDEIRQTQTEGQPVRGYVFYHMQDTESAYQEGLLYLAYGSTERTAAAMQTIGHEIVAALQNVGLLVSWNGELNKRIGVQVEWKRRRFTIPTLE